jgi:hypothetical protein
MLPRKRLRFEVDGGGCDFFFFLLSSLIFRVFVISFGPRRDITRTQNNPGRQSRDLQHIPEPFVIKLRDILLGKETSNQIKAILDVEHTIPSSSARLALSSSEIFSPEATASRSRSRFEFHM